MGFNKEELKLNGERIVFNQISKLKNIFEEVIVISPNKDMYINQEVKVYTDLLKSKGPLAGLHSGLTHSKTEYNYLIACDMPELDENFIHQQVDKLSNKEAYIVKNGEFFEPFHGFYNKSILSKIKEFLEIDQSFQRFIGTLSRDELAFESSIFTNLNTIEELNKSNLSNNYKIFQIEKQTGNGMHNTSDNVINEYPLTLFINDEKYITLLITPNNIEELIVGYLSSEKLIEDYSEIKDIDIDISNNKVSVSLINEIDTTSHNKDLLLTSGCGVGTKFHEDLDSVITDSIITDFRISKEEIYNASETLNNYSGLFKLTGGVHSALYIYNNENIYVEDIGRHNAVDKIVGHIKINAIPTINSYIFASGRISSDMLLKCAVSRIPIVISRSAPTSLAITLAEKYGITLVGFARGKKFNVYTHSFRIKR